MRHFDNTHITALTDLINKATQDVIAEYAAVGQAVPSLDTLQPGPFQVPEETPTRLIRAIQIIEAACAQLSFTVAPPGSVMVNKSLEHEEPACLLVVTEARIADLLLGRPEGLPASELASRSGLDAKRLTRILRLLATKHCFKEIKPGVFANNRLSMKLLSSDTVSSIVCLLTDESLLASAYLNDTLTDPSEMDGGIPFRRATGYPFFDFHKTRQGLKKGERFPRAMVGWGDVTGKGFLAKVYPWTSLPADTTVCDIGGGNGHVTMSLMKAHPHIKLVLQDQPQVIEMARKFWDKEYPKAIENQRVEFVPFDFFKDAAVQGCDFYYIRSILRDWPDVESEIILKNVRKAMKPSSRVIIHDTVLRDAVHTHETSSNEGTVQLDIAPEPLLPNYGVARVRTYELDMTMMNLLNAQARTLPEFIELGKNCGLKFENLYEAGEVDLVEFSPI
ncbi:MAG: S-adenosyl-L-methionine-dependent methyltransferase [Lentinula lateritia]|uniref:S-adenosyl-L-methionine-dependent methyltransferase n=1 Tax=Lentinula lateritia TaxID=40482 RepID=A0ABQ8V074_9AGAR|nr:MAG: S-adenosyl-L-methionine-dependent methyltransferase [Lentinula lateritia]KAJ4467788.1 S-adenosyl-L-methionine-dependent methyltransferase [Lentinula lateritia]